MKIKLLFLTFILVLLSANFLSCEKVEETLIPEKGSEKSIDPEKFIDSFSFQTEGNDLKNSIKGIFDENTIKLNTLAWINNPQALIATFTGKGKVTVNGTEQVSGITVNDFSTEVVYTITADDKSVRTYKVALSSPQTSGLPVLKVDTKDAAPVLDKVNYVPGTVKVVDTSNESYNAEYTMGIRGRGNSTWTYPKKPYKIKLDTKNPVLGLKEEKALSLR